MTGILIKRGNWGPNGPPERVLSEDGDGATCQEPHSSSANSETGGMPGTGSPHSSEGVSLLDFQPADGEGTFSGKVGLRWGSCYISPGELKQISLHGESSRQKECDVQMGLCARQWGAGEEGRLLCVWNWKHTDVRSTRGQTGDPWVSVSAPDLGSRGRKQRWQLSRGCLPGGGGHLGTEPESSRRKGMEEGLGVQRRWGRRGALACLGRTPAGGFTSARHSSPLSGTALGGHHQGPSPRRSSEP